MRSIPLCLIAVLAGFGPGVARAAEPAGLHTADLHVAALPGADLLPAAFPADLPALERAWHGCVREAYAQQPDAAGRAGAQRGALDACRAEEDSYVAALMAARAADDRGLTTRALAWAASVAASVVDPVSGWIARLRR